MRGNNEVNIFHACTNELSNGYGYDLGVGSGSGGFTIIDAGYCEHNAKGGIFISNNQKTKIRDVYFNLQNRSSAIVLGGTVGPNYSNPSVSVEGCRVLGSASGSASKFIEELGPSSINCQYADNTLEDNACNMYGTAQKSINLRRKGRLCHIVNARSITQIGASGAPDGWTLGGQGNVSLVASVSPYVSGFAASISNSNRLIFQRITAPASSLVRVTVWARCSGSQARASLQVWSLGFDKQYKAVSSSSAASVPLELHLTPSERSNSGTAFLLVLMNAGFGDEAQFNDVEIEDMSA